MLQKIGAGKTSKLQKHLVVNSSLSFDMSVNLPELTYLTGLACACVCVSILLILYSYHKFGNRY